jgi:hypothetical protein
VTVSVDIQESPVPDLSQIRNVYHGSASCVYAFLVVTASTGTETGMQIAAYELGYRLVSPDASVINQGFHRLEGWQRLSDEAELPRGQRAVGPRLPAAIGYWKLELKRGRESRAEFRIVPNALSGRAGIGLIDGDGNLIRLSYKALSEDRRCFGLINRTFYLNQPYVWTGEEPRDGQIVAAFMPGVIDMPGRVGTSSDIIDPMLREIAERFGLISIKSLCGIRSSNNGTVYSRTGQTLRLRKCNTYGLSFPLDTDMPALLDSIRALPRCEFAGIIDSSVTGVRAEESRADPVCYCGMSGSFSTCL